MAASVRFRPADRDLGMVMREVDENLAIFLGLKIESEGDDPKPERTDPVHDNHLLDSETDSTSHNQHPTGFSCPHKPRTQLPKECIPLSKNEVKRKPLSSSLQTKPTPRSATPIKPKPSRASTPTPIRSTFPSSKTRQTPCGASQTSKPKPSKSSETQIKKGLLHHRRPASASRVRPSNGVNTTQTSSNVNGDDVNPVAMGTKMVERVVNMRKLARPKQDDESSNTKKPLGFGRLLSKNSLDMAIRHMGIKGSVHDSLSPIKTGSSSSAKGIRSSSSKNSVISVPESPVTSSSESSMSSY